MLNTAIIVICDYENRLRFSIISYVNTRRGAVIADIFKP